MVLNLSKNNISFPEGLPLSNPSALGNNSMYSDDEMIMISALQHYLFCPRQCALIHIEHIWAENYLTASGKVMHEYIDSGIKESRQQYYKESAVKLFSRQWGISGIADVIEFHPCKFENDENGIKRAVALQKHSGWWIPSPVEYKRGKSKTHNADRIQLCAQAICLEEMLSVNILHGNLFYYSDRSREKVLFDYNLRQQTHEVILKTHELLQKKETPPPVLSNLCKACSLNEYCLSGRTERSHSVSCWLSKNIAELVK